MKESVETNFLRISYWGRTYFVRDSVALVVKPGCTRVLHMILPFILFYFTLFLFIHFITDWI